MSKANVVLAAAAVVFGSGCFVLFRDLSTERNRVYALEAQVARLQREMKAPEPVSSDKETAPTSDPGAEAVAAKPAASSSTSASSTPAATKSVAAERSAERAEWRRVLADPAYREAMRAEQRLRLKPQYPELAAELGLSQDEADRFLDLLAEQSLRDSESAMEEKPGEDPQQRIRKRHEQAENERRAFLGEERFRAWTEYVNSAGARALVSDLRAQLATSSSPLREDQSKPLVKALAAEHQRHWAERQQNYSSAVWTEKPVAERIAYMERRAALIEESLERSREAGAMYLDSEQQRRFDEMLDRQRERARAEFELWRASLEAEKRGKAAAGSR
jgi:hypothetical protein